MIIKEIERRARARTGADARTVYPLYMKVYSDRFNKPIPIPADKSFMIVFYYDKDYHSRNAKITLSKDGDQAIVRITGDVKILD